MIKYKLVLKQEYKRAGIKMSKYISEGWEGPVEEINRLFTGFLFSPGNMKYFDVIKSNNSGIFKKKSILTIDELLEEYKKDPAYRDNLLKFILKSENLNKANFKDVCNCVEIIQFSNIFHYENFTKDAFDILFDRTFLLKDSLNYFNDHEDSYLGFLVMFFESEFISLDQTKTILDSISDEATLFDFFEKSNYTGKVFTIVIQKLFELDSKASNKIKRAILQSKYMTKEILKDSIDNIKSESMFSSVLYHASHFIDEEILLKIIDNPLCTNEVKKDILNHPKSNINIFKKIYVDSPDEIEEIYNRDIKYWDNFLKNLYFNALKNLDEASFRMFLEELKIKILLNIRTQDENTELPKLDFKKEYYKALSKHLTCEIREFRMMVLETMYKDFLITKKQLYDKDYRCDCRRPLKLCIEMSNIINNNPNNGELK